MDSEILNPFISSTINTITTMAGVRVSMGKPYARKDAGKTLGEVNGIMKLKSRGYVGSMMIGFQKGPLMAIVNGMLGEEYDEINDEILDSVGEITNIIAGGVKQIMNQKGFSFDMQLPKIIQGKNVAVDVPKNTPSIGVPFTTEHGPFVVEACLREEL